jgi:DNA-binding transcriptional ArsR family regulator
MIEIWKAIGTPRRREILRVVWDQERSVGEIWKTQSGVTMGAVSQHLRLLEEAGLVERRQKGVQHFYIARKDALGPIGACLQEMWDTALYRLKMRAEIEQARRGPRSTRRKTR